MKYVTVSLHNSTFYLPQDSVLHIEHRAVITKVPLAPGWIVGIMAYRNEPISVIDAFVCGASAAELQIICSTECGAAAYQADSIGDFCDIDESGLQALVSEGSPYLKHIRVTKTEM